MDDREAELRDARPSTLYLGGGTPSMLGAAGLTKLLALVRARVDLRSVDEATIELNPEHADLIDALPELGFHRASLGVQSFDAEALRQLGRVHDPGQAEHAAARCIAAGLRTSIDLIVGWPGQSDASLHDDLARTIALGPEHASIYALTIEAGTPWPKLVRRGLRALPDEDRQGDALARVEATLADAGYAHYEIASYAKRGAIARHNTAYWRWRDYVGLGPSAASAHYEEGSGAVVRRTNARGLTAWLGNAPPEIERLEPTAAAAEGLWLGLRMLEGFDVAAFLARFVAIDRAWLDARTGPACARGDLTWTVDGRLQIAPGRWLHADAIAARLIA
jgi:oxygen-independent coproporphyrinogen-3 oxidase